MTTNNRALGGRLRSRSIRYPILAIAWIPSLVLLIIGLVVAGTLAYQGSQVRSYNGRFDDASQRAAAFTTAVFVERRASQTHVLNPTANARELTAAQARVDQTLPPFLAAVRVLSGEYPQAYGEIGPYLDELSTRLPRMRQRVATGQAGLVEVSEFYSDVSGAVVKNLFDTVQTQPVPRAATEQTISVTLLRATDDFLDADAFAVAAFVKPGGLSDAEFARFALRYGGARSRLAEVEPLLQTAERRDLVALTGSPAWRQLAQAHALALETRVEQPEPPSDRASSGRSEHSAQTGPDAAAPTPPMDPRTWGQNTGQVIQGITGINLRHSAYSADISARQGDSQLNRSLVVGALLLLLAVVVFVATTWASNRIVRRLRRLRSDTIALSRERLPAIVDQLRDGRPVDVAAELPPLEFGRDEIGEVAEAFEEAQRTAVSAAAREAETRAGLRMVFLDIAHRSQAIVHRQLRVLDQAERSQEDPDQLALLFQLDHLATRARRNAENLIILGGGQAGRQWRNPVPLIEITRSAISEAEDYVRVSIAGLPDVSVSGSVVADVIHLLAELVDNATSFSPPMSRVEVRGNLVGRGIVIEVEDQGLGIEPSQLDELNRMLHEPPDFQVMALADEPRLGLFVVAQLAARHGIRVTLTPSPAYGGTRVVVLLPNTLVAGSPAVEAPRQGPARLPDEPMVAASPEAAPVSERPPLRALRTAPSLETVLTAPELFVAPGSDAEVPDVPGPDARVHDARVHDAERSEDGLAPGVFAAPLRDTGLFSARHREGVAGAAPSEVPESEPGVVDLRPYDPQEPAGRPELPRRTRQTHLSPQLRDVPPDDLEPARPRADLPDADEARSRMTALQRGTLRGRADEPEE